MIIPLAILILLIFPLIAGCYYYYNVRRKIIVSLQKNGNIYFTTPGGIYFLKKDEINVYFIETGCFMISLYKIFRDSNKKMSEREGIGGIG